MARRDVSRASGGGGFRRLRLRWVRAGLFGAAVVLLGGLACGDGPTEPPPLPPPPPPVATTVAVSPASAALSSIGETVQFAIEVRDQNGRAISRASVAWTSSDVAVAAVDASGLATAAGNGTATITATSGSASGTAAVTVEQTVASVAITPDSAVLLVGDTLRLSATAMDALGAEVEDAAVAWLSGDTLVATVDSSGLASAIARGAVKITAKSSGVEGRAQLVVAVAAPTMVAVTPDSVSLTALGDTSRLSAEVFDQVGRLMPGAAVVWSSADSTVATVDSAGLVRAERPGAAKVTASSGSASGSASVSVMQSASSVAVTPAEARIGPGDTLQLVVEAFDANGHVVAEAEFSWLSSDESVVTVDGSGLMRGVAEGTATITASAGDTEGASKITVVNPDRAALVALYEATDGPNWVNNDNWLTDVPLADWHGAWTDTFGRVVSLNLRSNGLIGPIPPELGSLASLAELNLWDNRLTGPIPPELGGLANLTHLNLWENGLTGPIPPELGGLANLTRLNLWENGLIGPIPPELGSLASLAELNLWDNRLAGPIPPELGGLANLTQLNLWENGFTGPIPPELGGLANLTNLNLSGNDLSGAIPPELGSLANLTHLNLWKNGLSGAIPLELGGLANLTNLDLSANGLSGAIPRELGGLASLDWLALGSNALGGAIPPELGGLANLRLLVLSDNDLSGQIPPELGGLTNLRSLGLRDTYLSGPIPLELVELAGLRALGLADTDVCVPGVVRFVRWIDGLGSFDGSYCNEVDEAVLESLYESAGGQDWPKSGGWLGGPALEEWHGVDVDPMGRVLTLDLAGNGLVGGLPSILGRLTELTELRIGENGGLAGRLPVSLTRLSLSVLHYAGTDLCSPADDSFRTWLGGVASHEGTGVECAPVVDRDILFDLYRTTGGPSWVNSDNWLTDAPLVEWWGVETDASGRVVSLDLGSNGLSGPLPAELVSLANVIHLDVSGNAVFGPIPPELGGLTSLSRLDLASNDLSGPIPPELGSLANLRSLGLRDNGLSGPIPPELGGLANLTGLDLASNGLSGPIPPELGSLASLRSLGLRDNGLSGPIPPELGDLADLEVLSLGRNKLTGPIPPELGNLDNLLYLHLRHNDLSGPIPPELGGLASLSGLVLSDNNLTGPIPAELGGLPSLRSLVLWNNDLSGPIPPELGGLTNLSGLHLDRNSISGPVPPELSGLANLRWLHLGGNGILGPVPPELGDLARLETLSLPDNDLSGSLPAELGRLAALTELDVAGNAALSGPLPASLANLRDLETLNVHGTGLCAPGGDADIQVWLARVPEAWVASCAPAAAYLVQAVQSREFPVPLVAGEEALLRVFVTAARESDAGMPPVRARFHLNGTETYVIDIAGSSVPIPTEVDEGDMSRSANAAIPGDVVRPGLEIVIEVDAEGTLDPALGVTERIPATGRLPVDVREMPPFDLTVIPFLWASEPDSSVIGFAEDMASDPGGHELLAATRTLLPVADLAVTAHAPVMTSSRSGFDVLRETEVVQALERGVGHHMGLMADFSGALAGVALVGGRASASVPDGDVIAHEFGHNMNLGHAPCGRAPDPDPRYPYPSGSIGAWGYDFPGEYEVRRGGEPVRPGTADMMGYCDPRWVSDYHFARALRFRLADEGAPAAVVRSILVWGGVDDNGAPFLEPAFVVDAPPALPDSVGEHTAVGRTADGTQLFSLDFTMPEIADADGASAFAFVVPAEPGWASALASLKLTGPGGEATLDGDTNRPMAILRDLRSGEVRGFIRDLSPAVAASGDLATALSSEPGLEALFSRGIPDPTAWRR